MTDFSSLPLIDQTDRDILMHKDAHFEGSFALMLEYYEKEGKGAIEEFEIDRIQELALLEQQNGISLSENILTEEEKEEVLASKKKYSDLKKIYDLPPGPAQKIADLVFSEDFEAEPEIQALANDPKCIPLLIQLIQEDPFYNPIFPGYGFAPLHAMEALGLLKAQEAIIPLFESLSKTEFFGEEAAIHALFKIGQPAKEFLLGVLQKTPLSKDNENAAIALLPFREDPRVSSACIQMLFLPEVQARPTLFTYLLLACEQVSCPEDQHKLQEIAKLSNLSQENREELDWILRSFTRKAKS